MRPAFISSSPADVTCRGPWSEPLSSWRLGSATPAANPPSSSGTSFGEPPCETREDRTLAPVLHFFGALA
jgi:hypothetical protein